MNHPEYPLMHSERAAIIMDGKTAEDVERIQKEFARRRNAEFPGWRDVYDKEVREWVKWQKRFGYRRLTPKGESLFEPRIGRAEGRS